MKRLLPITKLLTCLLFTAIMGSHSFANDYFINPVLWHVHASDDGSRDRLVLLTIDDVPTKNSTTDILDLLDEFDIRALFFINGNLGIQHPDLVRDIIHRGHEIGNHTWDHGRLSELDRLEAEAEITKVYDWLEEELQYEARFFRPPYGVSTPVSDSVVAKLGMKNMGWSVNSFDWLYPDDEFDETTAPGEIVRRTLKNMEDGGIILLHDKVISKQALRDIIEELLGKGYIFVDPFRISS